MSSSFFSQFTEVTKTIIVISIIIITSSIHAINKVGISLWNYVNCFITRKSLLADLLKRSKPSRIIVVASELYRLACLNLNNINPTSALPAYLYYVSKYADIVFTLELARRLEGSGVTANCLHPGMIDSGIWRSVPAPLSWGLNFIIKAFFKTPEQGAQTTIHLAVSDELNGISGKYFMDCAVRIIFHLVKLNFFF